MTSIKYNILKYKVKPLKILSERRVCIAMFICSIKNRIFQLLLCRKGCQIHRICIRNTIFCASKTDTITYTYSQTQKRVHVYSLMIASACIENHCWYQRNERKFGIGYLYKNRTIYRMLC